MRFRLESQFALLSDSAASSQGRPIGQVGWRVQPTPGTHLVPVPMELDWDEGDEDRQGHARPTMTKAYATGHLALVAEGPGDGQ